MSDQLINRRGNVIIKYQIKGILDNVMRGKLS